MSQFKIAMKKDFMKKNTKLVINISLDKDASRFEAAQGLGSLREEKKQSSESSERLSMVKRVCCKAEIHNLGSSRVQKDRFGSESRKDVFQRVSFKDEEIDKAIDDHHSVVRDGMMREVDVGTGLSGALNRLREQGTFRGESKLVVGVKDKHEGDRFRDGFKDIQIQRVDKWGRTLNQKEAYRALCHGFHGKQPGKRKQEKRKKKLEDKSKQMVT
ncbi:SART-1 family protein DOT2 [Capsella rubella]|uniref:SART-1 family protein DOT2 n=1 Tax=Capsella rubella TaxID=81985 RepID=UPI000CD593F2|nr:SART-1 family protein DOT2 [Capsella rubella]XP_023642721.1 SART-1 family protein DOT2 [Capsella rubella]XP_023642722.1 SART-1 family protein DOT2 [Capsella rubella]